MLETKHKHHDPMTRPKAPAPSAGKQADRFPPPLCELILHYCAAAPPCELTAQKLRGLAPETRRMVIGQLQHTFGNDFTARVIHCMDHHGLLTWPSPDDSPGKKHRPTGAEAEKWVETAKKDMGKPQIEHIVKPPKSKDTGKKGT